MVRPVLYSALTIDYPSADGLPMAEIDVQCAPLIYAIEALQVYFQAREDVYVSGNLCLYYEDGNPQAVVAPDVFVALGPEVRLEQGRLRFFDPATEAYLLTHQESKQARQAAEARLAELQAQLQALEAKRPAPPSPPDAVQL